jgi:DNA-binding transcriptional ArsR family regulator
VTQHDAGGARPTPGRLEYERAIRRSDLPPPSRHIALTIATWSDMDTGRIPERYQPSLSTLAEATGLNRATVQRHLDRLEADGWIVRDRPEAKKARMEHARTRYSLALPPGARRTEHLGAESTQPLGAESTQAGCTEHLELGAESTTRVPKSLESQDAVAGKPASGQRKPNRHQVADDLTAAFWEHHGKGRAQPFPAVRGVIRTAISNGVARDDLARALDQVAREGRSISGATLDIALGNLRRGAYQNPADQDVYDEDLIK